MGCVRAQALWSGSKPAQTGSRLEHEKTPRRSAELQLTWADNQPGACGRSAGSTKRHSEVKGKEDDAGGRTAPSRGSSNLGRPLSSNSCVLDLQRHASRPALHAPQVPDI